MRTIAYIDGFNLFSGCLKRSPYKWLDLDALCQTLFPSDQINLIRYFTAPVLAFPHNPDAPTNQAFYLRALGTLPNVTIHRDGWFAARPSTLPQHPIVYLDGPNNPPKLVTVMRMEEKRTDVDIATQLLGDCFDHAFDKAVVISSDTDLVPPIDMIRKKFGRTVVAVNTHRSRRMSKHLVQAATDYVRKINPSVLRNCQLPSPLTDAAGAFTKPPTW